MVSYSSWNGTKMHANRHLLTDVLKGELGFRGFLVSDWAAIDQINPDYSEDIATSINAGLDMIMIPYAPGKHANDYVAFIGDLKALVASGRVPMARIDDAVRRILRIKFQMGIFDHPYPDAALTAEIGSAGHREVARECVRASLVLLKNDHGALPISKAVRHLVVVGAAADDLGMQCGGWTISWQGGRGEVTHGGTTILAAIRRAVSPGTLVTFSPDGLAVQGADAIVAVVGEAPYAEMKGDRTDLRLPDEDIALDRPRPRVRRPGRHPVAVRPAADPRSRTQFERRLRRGVAPRHRRPRRGRRPLRRLSDDRKTAPHLAGHERPARDGAAGAPALFPYSFGLAD